MRVDASYMKFHQGYTASETDGPQWHMHRPFRARLDESLQRRWKEQQEEEEEQTQRLDWLGVWGVTSGGIAGTCTQIIQREVGCGWGGVGGGGGGK